MNHTTFKCIAGEAIVGVIPNDSPTWSLLVGASVEHTVKGIGKVTRVDLRGTYTPLIHISFAMNDAKIPLDRFSTGRFTLQLPQTAVDAFFAEIESVRKSEQEQDLRTQQSRKLHEEKIRRDEEQARRQLESINQSREAELARFTREQSERKRILRETLPERHRQRIEALGLEYRGIRKVSRARNRRITHCWSCKSGLDNEVDVECASCGWILCTCGACGCDYDRPQV